MHKKLLRWGLVLSAASPALSAAYFIRTYSIDFPLIDQWSQSISGMFIKAADGELRFSDVYAPHNEHRMFLPKLAFLGLGLMTHWNTIAEFWLSWVLAVLTAAGLLVLCLRTTIREPMDSAPGSAAGFWNDPLVQVLPVWMLCNLWVFGVRQWENWVAGIGVANIMIPTWVVAMAVAWTSPLSRVQRTILTGACAVAATFTSGNGFLCWPLGAILVLASANRKELIGKKWLVLGWLMAFGVTLAAYFIGYVSPATSPGENEGVGTWSDLLLYPVAFAGGAFATGTPLHLRDAALLFGTIQLILYVAAAAYCVHVWRRRSEDDTWRRLLVWLVLGAFAIASGVMAAPMRARFGVGQAASSRYVTFSLFMPIALFNLIPLICADIRRNAPSWLRGWKLWIQIPAAGAALVLLLELIATLIIFKEYRTSYYLERRSMKAATLLTKVLPGNPFITPAGFPVIPGLEDRARDLDRIGFLRPPLIESTDLRAYRAAESVAAGPTGPWGVFEDLQRTPEGQFLASGWAVGPRLNRPADLILLTVRDDDGREFVVVPGRTGLLRRDISARFGTEDVVQAGWSITGALPPYAPGTRLYISAWALDADTGTAFQLNKHATLDL